MHSEFSIQVKTSIRRKLNLLFGNFPYINAKKKMTVARNLVGLHLSWTVGRLTWWCCLKCVYFLIKLIATITCLHAHSKLRGVCRGEQET